MEGADNNEESTTVEGADNTYHLHSIKFIRGRSNRMKKSGAEFRGANALFSPLPPAPFLTGIQDITADLLSHFWRIK